MWCGVSSNGLSIEWMNQEKMEKAERLIVKEKSIGVFNSGEEDLNESRTPEGLKRHSKQYLRYKLEKSEEKNAVLKKKLSLENEIDFEAIPGFLQPKKENQRTKSLSRSHKYTAHCQEVIF